MKEARLDGSARLCGAGTAPHLRPGRCRARATRRSRVSVVAGAAAVRSFHVSLQTPTVDHLGVETPIGADPKARQLSAAKQLVDRRWMHAQIFGQFLDRHHARQAILGFTSHDIPR